jgi:thiamine kinase-like enzyme
MADDGVAQAREVLHGIQKFWTIENDDIEIRRLGGLTNLVFFVDYHGEQYVLRLPGKGTEEYINRAHEHQAASEAAKALVAPDIVHFDSKSGVMVTRFVDNAVTMSPAAFAERKGAATRAAEVFRKLHTSGAKFSFRFELFAMIDDYLKVLSKKKNVELPEGYHDTLKDAEKVRKALAAHKLPLAPCHCDPLCENFLDTGKRMWLVDWEYAGMNDPVWDLGDLAVEAQLSPELEDELLAAYFPAGPSAAERGRFVIYKAMCDLLWTLWGLVQHANQNPADDFWAYSLNRFERCKALMASPEFAVHVSAVKKG